MAKVNGTKASGGLPKAAPSKGTPAGSDNIKQTLRGTNVSVANMHSDVYPGTKTSGIKIRGTGCATKGVMARGPMG